MLLFAFIPGLPFIPFIIGASCLAAAAWIAHHTGLREAAAADAPRKSAPPPSGPSATSSTSTRSTWSLAQTSFRW